MRIKAIRLSWFRGAADSVSLEPDCKSMVVYGANGSGKSSFTDAVEFVLKGGKIAHLVHEYSGRRQEKAIPNTHKPEGQSVSFSIKFKDDSELKTVVLRDGSFTRSGGETAAMDTWDYGRTVLRQDEVAAFIHQTKGGKYSALLPLLGLQPMEVAAENLRQLARSIEQVSGVRETRVKLDEAQAKRTETFGTDSDAQILARIEDVHGRHCTDKPATKDASSRCKEVSAALDTRITRSSADQRRHIALKDIASLDLEGHVDAMRNACGKLASGAEPLIVERLEVLQRASVFVDRLGDDKDVECPACGQSIAVDAFQAHVDAERERLGEIIGLFDLRKAAIGTLCDTIQSLKSSIGKIDARPWRDEIAKGPLAASLAYLDGIDVQALRASCEEEELKMFEGSLLPLIDVAKAGARDAPPDAQQLWADMQVVLAASTAIAATEQATEVESTETLISFINLLEEGIREEIRLRSRAIIEEISEDLQAMWAILHPGEAIGDVRLYVPEDTDKAIDISLKFHGVEQDSPRLTLSEGHRNSLGLCIFLAMAKREADKDRPLFLDDVVVSLDRGHRGMIAELLEEAFSARQVVILTHDRDWYSELRQQLDGKSWLFKALLPYDTPQRGIRWSHKITTFDDARAQLPDRPDSAGNDARKIMDVELALIAERLGIRLPYLRGDENDKRMAHDFLERLIADGGDRFQRRDKASDPYQAQTDAINKLEEADRLLSSWANRASHTFDLVRPEATKLIDVCAKALECFWCSSCGRGVWFADAEGSEWVQCQCGQVRWRYGRGRGTRVDAGA